MREFFFKNLNRPKVIDFDIGLIWKPRRTEEPFRYICFFLLFDLSEIKHVKVRSHTTFLQEQH
jgi:hypothetical protein